MRVSSLLDGCRALVFTSAAGDSLFAFVINSGHFPPKKKCFQPALFSTAYHQSVKLIPEEIIFRSANDSVGL
jgi:hypothetical protein